MKRDKCENTFVHDFSMSFFFISVLKRKRVWNHSSSGSAIVAKKRQSVPNKIMTIDFRFSLPVQNAHILFICCCCCHILGLIYVSQSLYADGILEHLVCQKQKVNEKKNCLLTTIFIAIVRNQQWNVIISKVYFWFGKIV